MATIQSKISRGHKYWYIVESRRVNGKPRPVVLAYLGKADDLLKKLQGLRQEIRVKSHSHGAVALLLHLAGLLDIPRLINRHVRSSRHYMPDKPVRNHLTVGVTLLLAAIGRACAPTSKQGWREWAKSTTCEHLLQTSLAKLDSQHFWDLMDALPIEAIPSIERELLQKALELFPVGKEDTLSFDTTNFFTFIATTNARCTLAQRGKNKQKRHDLRQVGLALVVTRSAGIPLFHLTYQGNRNDSKVFGEVVVRIKDRLAELNFDLETHTLVFDRGNNSRANLEAVAEAGLHYVGALTPYHHAGLLQQAEGNYAPVTVGDVELDVYRARQEIWGQDRTVLVFVSERLKAGQLRGVFQVLAKKEAELRRLQKSLLTPKGKTTDEDALEKRLQDITRGQFLKGLFSWSILRAADHSLALDFSLDAQRLQALEDEVGFRILMTDRHDWASVDIIQAFYGQSAVEQAFKDVKNPLHLAVRPQFHWTNQKIAVHFFLCLVGYLLSMLLLSEARSKAGFRGSVATLLERLGRIRLASLLECTGTQGRPKATYELEAVSDDDRDLFFALGGASLHIDRPKLNGVGVYD